MNVKVLCPVLALLLTSHQNALAEKMPTLDQLVVNSDHTKALTSQRLASPVPFVGATQEELEKQPALQLGDALKRLPSVYLSGNINDNDNLQIRGLPKQYSRIQIDGVQIPDGGGESREFQVNRLLKTSSKKPKSFAIPPPNTKVTASLGVSNSTRSTSLTPFKAKSTSALERATATPRSGTAQSSLVVASTKISACSEP